MRSWRPKIPTYDRCYVGTPSRLTEIGVTVPENNQDLIITCQVIFSDHPDMNGD